MANGQQQGATVFERALQASTPGFDQLLGTIQQETQRINQAQQMVAQRQAEMDIFEQQQEIKLDAQKEQIEAQTEAEKDLLRFKNSFKSEEPTFDSEKLYKEADNKSDSIRNEFSQVFRELNITGPDIKPTIDPTTQSPIYYQAVGNYSEDQDVAELDDQEFQSDLNSLNDLANYMKDIRDAKPNMISSEEVPEGAEDEYIAKDETEQFLSSIRNATYKEKVAIAQKYNQGGNFPKPATAENLGTVEADKERDLSANEEDVQRLYLDLDNNYRNLTVPDMVKRYQPDIGENFDPFGPNVTYGDIEKLRRNLNQMLKEETVEVTQLETGNTVFEDPYMQQLYEGVTKYTKLMHKSNELPNTKVNPGKGLPSGSFGLREINMEEQPINEIWEDRSDVQGEFSITDMYIKNAFEIPGDVNFKGGNVGSVGGRF